jgi:hypothetical protein
LMPLFMYDLRYRLYDVLLYFEFLDAKCNANILFLK